MILFFRSVATRIGRRNLLGLQANDRNPDSFEFDRRKWNRGRSKEGKTFDDRIEIITVCLSTKVQEEIRNKEGLL